jgi:hypothetical protein
VEHDTRETAVLVMMRRLVLGLVALGTAGIIVELLLVAHYEDANQLIPLAVAGVGLLAVMWAAISPTVVSLRTLQFVMLLYAGAGIIGIALHYQASVKLLLDKDPSLAGCALFAQAVRAAAPPALAPGVLVQLGLLGLAHTYRHPLLQAEPLA